MVKKILLGLLVLAIAVQFYRPEKNLAAAPAKTDLLALHPAPAEVRQLLQAEVTFAVRYSRNSQNFLGAI